MHRPELLRERVEPALPRDVADEGERRDGFGAAARQDERWVHRLARHDDEIDAVGAVAGIEEDPVDCAERQRGRRAVRAPAEQTPVRQRDARLEQAVQRRDDDLVGVEAKGDANRDVLAGEGEHSVGLLGGERRCGACGGQSHSAGPSSATTKSSRVACTLGTPVLTQMHWAPANLPLRIHSLATPRSGLAVRRPSSPIFAVAALLVIVSACGQTPASVGTAPAATASSGPTSAPSLAASTSASSSTALATPAAATPAASPSMPVGVTWRAQQYPNWAIGRGSGAGLLLPVGEEALATSPA